MLQLPSGLNAAPIWAHEILVSAQGPLVYGFLVFSFLVWGLGVWGLGLTIYALKREIKHHAHYLYEQQSLSLGPTLLYSNSECHDERCLAPAGDGPGAPGPGRPHPGGPLARHGRQRGGDGGDSGQYNVSSIHVLREDTI